MNEDFWLTLNIELYIMSEITIPFFYLTCKRMSQMYMYILFMFIYMYLCIISRNIKYTYIHGCKYLYVYKYLSIHIRFTLW